MKPEWTYCLARNVIVWSKLLGGWQNCDVNERGKSVALGTLPRKTRLKWEAHSESSNEQQYQL
jgi:hypothetical protein